MDGEYLMNTVVWQIEQSFGIICQEHLTFRKHYANNIAVIFDRYDNIWSNKAAEHKQRYFITTSEVVSDENTVIHTKQSIFLSKKNQKKKPKHLTQN